MTDDQPPTELARPIDATEASLAWSIDDTPEVVAYRPPWIARTAVAAALVLIAGAGAVALFMQRPDPVEVSATEPVAPTTTTVTVAPAAVEPAPSRTKASPSPVPPPSDAGPWFGATETAASRTPPPPPDYDARFVANLQAAGWNVWNPADVVPHAHTVCMALRNGDTVPSINQQMVAAGLLYPREAVSFTETAMATYPDCP